MKSNEVIITKPVRTAAMNSCLVSVTTHCVGRRWLSYR